VSTGRVLWLIWCLGWAGFWLIFGWFLLGFNLVLAVGAVAAILIPVGKNQLPAPPQIPQLPPLCMNCGTPAAAHQEGRCPHHLPAPQSPASQ